MVVVVGVSSVLFILYRQIYHNKFRIPYIQFKIVYIHECSIV